MGFIALNTGSATRTVMLMTPGEKGITDEINLALKDFVTCFKVGTSTMYSVEYTFIYMINATS